MTILVTNAARFGGCLAVVLMASCAFASGPLAAEPTERIRQALASLPGAALASGTNVLADVMDLGLLRQVGGFVEGRLSTAAVDGLGLGLEPWRAAQAMRYASDASWMEATGFDRRSLVSVTLAGDLRNQMSLWQFRDAGEAATAFERLPELGFAPMPTLPDLPDALANGPLGTLRLLQRDRANLFEGELGYAVLVARARETLLVAQTPLLMHGLRDDRVTSVLVEKGNLGAGETRRVEFDQALRAADAVLPLDTLVLQARILSASASVTTADAKIFSVIAKLRGLLLPPHDGFVLVRVEVPGAWRGAVVSIPYADCDRARLAADALSGQWAMVGLLKEARDAKLSAADVLTTTVAAGGGCAALMVVKLDASWTMLLDRNNAYKLLAETAEYLPVLAIVSGKAGPRTGGTAPVSTP